MYDTLLKGMQLWIIGAVGAYIYYGVNVLFFGYSDFILSEKSPSGKIIYLIFLAILIGILLLMINRAKKRLQTPRDNLSSSGLETVPIENQNHSFRSTVFIEAMRGLSIVLFAIGVYLIFGTIIAPELLGYTLPFSMLAFFAWAALRRKLNRDSSRPRMTISGDGSDSFWTKVAYSLSWILFAVGTFLIFVMISAPELMGSAVILLILIVFGEIKLCRNKTETTTK